MGRSLCCDQDAGVTKGPGTPQEDKLLLQKNGHGSWLAAGVLFHQNCVMHQWRLADVKNKNGGGVGVLVSQARLSSPHLSSTSAGTC
jgi:hypothetical protein